MRCGKRPVISKVTLQIVGQHINDTVVAMRQDGQSLVFDRQLVDRMDQVTEKRILTADYEEDC